MAEKNFQVGDLVWAKMKSYPYWPAQIVHPPPQIKVPSLKKVQHCVRFYGTGDHAWITIDSLVHHSDDMVLKSKKGTKKIAVALQNAIKEIVEISKDTHDNVTSPINGEVDSEEGEVEEMSSNPSPRITAKKVRKKKKSVMEDVEKDEDDQEDVDEDDQENVEKDEDDQENVEKDEDDQEDVEKDEDDQEDVEKDEDDQEDVDEDDQEDVEKDNTELEAEENSIDQEGGDIEKDESEREETNIEESFSDEREETNIEESFSDERESSSEESTMGAMNGENEQIDSEASQHSAFGEKTANKVKKKGSLSLKRKKEKPNKSYKRMCSSPLKKVVIGDLPSPDLPSLDSSFSSLGYIERPPTPDIEMMKASEYLNAKDISPTDKKIGFLGLGMIGRGVVKNLLLSGHKVTVWNRNPAICEPFVKAGALKGLTPADVVASCDITFCCVSDSVAVKNLVFENCGVLKGIEGCTAGTKGYVEMTSIDPVTSLEVSKSIASLGGRYLEAPIIGSRQLANDGALLSLVAGDRELFNDCYSCFFAFTRNVYYLSNMVGYGSKMSLIQSMLYGTTAAALAEALALVKRCDLPQHKFLEILSMGPMSCPLVRDKGSAMTEKDFTVDTALKHQLKDLNLVLQLSDAHRQSTTISSAANQLFKRANIRNYSDHDISAVIMGAQ